MFQFPGLATQRYVFTLDSGHTPLGFPHSEIFGSVPVSGSPKLIAAVHVLLRLWLPRHPPYALRSLTVPLRHGSTSHAELELRALALRPQAPSRTRSLSGITCGMNLGYERLSPFFA